MTIYASDGEVIETAPQPAPETASVAASAPESEPVDVETEEVETTPEPETLPAVRNDDEDSQDEIHDAEVVPADDTDSDEPEKWVHQGPWAHDWLEYKGDKIAFRVPHQNALTALYQAGQACSPEFQMELTNKFVKRHLSQESIERVLERMSDPDDKEYAGAECVWNDLLRTIVEIGGKRALKDAEALAAVQNGKARS
ncbi:tail assembly chaperone [Mycobacterium phage Dori]|uniref:tail assembly chaperone n=1 Tax=Mycobacterium phage Dori TaxID=1089121 RepID=UPI000232F49B|nr:tail assembly chaperone [Mycobacterium phage Dori]AER47674.1 hypothetical protein DORI_23 [Mycobacterium phage Dori]